MIIILGKNRNFFAKHKNLILGAEKIRNAIDDVLLCRENWEELREETVKNGDYSRAIQLDTKMIKIIEHEL